MLKFAGSCACILILKLKKETYFLIIILKLNTKPHANTSYFLSTGSLVYGKDIARKSCNELLP